MHRRSFIQAGAAASLLGSLPRFAFAQQLPFDPKPAGWRTFEVTTRVELLKPDGVSRVWVPVPSVESDYQKVIGNTWSGNGSARIASDGKYGAAMVVAEWGAAEKAPVLEVVSRSPRRTARSISRKRNPAHQARRRDARSSTPRRPSSSPPTASCARPRYEITRGKSTDVEKARAIYEWIVDNTHRDPKTRGCGVGDIKAMLETGDLSGKCADLNALYVGLARVGRTCRRATSTACAWRRASSATAASAPAARTSRARSTAAPRCSSPATAGCRSIRPTCARSCSRRSRSPPRSPIRVVPPVRAKLFGAWEMNWLAYNEAHDVKLPGSSGPAVGFLMYPQAETGKASASTASTRTTSSTRSRRAS